MTREEASVIISKIMLLDNRKAGETPQEAALYVEHWYEILHDISFQDANRALIEHRKNSNEYIMPFHIRQYAKKYAHNRAIKAKPQAQVDLALIHNDYIRSQLLKKLGWSFGAWLDRGAPTNQELKQYIKKGDT